MSETATKTEQQRTELQNRALHLYFKFIAEALNDAGLDMRKVLKPHVSIPWSTETVKDYLWRPLQIALLGKKSTTQLSTKEIDKVFDVLNRHLGTEFGVQEDFPSVETIMYKQYGYATPNTKVKETN